MRAINKIEEARQILSALGYAKMLSSDVPPLTLLALADIRPDTEWIHAKKMGLGITREIMSFMRTYYARRIEVGTRETIRDEVLKVMILVGIAERNPGRPDIPTNSSRNFYALTESALAAIRRYGSSSWDKYLSQFQASHPLHRAATAQRQRRRGIVIALPSGEQLCLSPGGHSELIAAVIEEFRTVFAPFARLLYVGDTANREVFLMSSELRDLGITLDPAQPRPDVILFDAVKNRLFWIEAVTTSGQINDVRLSQLQELSQYCPLAHLFITVFPNFKTFARFAKEIAWETEVWVQESPEHLVHFNGETFLSR
jgi:hypothetical protein